MINTLGNPQQAGYAAVSLMCGGVLGAFPDLEVFLPHAGGTFPWLVGRLALAQAFSSELKLAKRPAEEYLRRFHDDLITHHPKIMRDLIDLAGVDRIVCGTDFPQGMSVRCVGRHRGRGVPPCRAADILHDLFCRCAQRSGFLYHLRGARYGKSSIGYPPTKTPNTALSSIFAFEVNRLAALP